MFVQKSYNFCNLEHLFYYVSLRYTSKTAYNLGCNSCNLAQNRAIWRFKF